MAVFKAGTSRYRGQGLRLVYAGCSCFVVWRGCFFLLRRLSPSRPIFSEFFCPLSTAYVFFSGLFVFFIAFVLPFAIGFELPLALIILARLGLVTGRSLRQKRRFFIVGVFIFAGVVSPTTDMITQTAIAVPLIFLYEGTIVVMRFMKP